MNTTQVQSTVDLTFPTLDETYHIQTCSTLQNNIDLVCSVHKEDSIILLRYPFPNDDDISLINIDKSIEIDQGDLDTLSPKTWLNNQIIQLYFKKLKLLSKNDDIHMMDTLFYPILK